MADKVKKVDEKLVAKVALRDLLVKAIESEETGAFGIVFQENGIIGVSNEVTDFEVRLVAKKERLG